MRLAVCMVVRNEVVDIPQWIIHHLNVGFDTCIVYDNASTDGSTELLSALSKIFRIHCISWPTPAGDSTEQIKVYNDCLSRFGQDFDWIAFIDLDEYLIPADPSLKIESMLSKFPDANAIGINWLIFGTSNVPNTHGKINLEVFTRRSEDQFSANRNVKSLVRPSAIRHAMNGHSFMPLDGSPTYNLDGDPIDWQSGWGIVPEDEVIVGDWRVHHYMIRSLEHWTRRINRGPNKKGGSWDVVFEHHDRNEIEDLTALPWGQQIRQIMDEHDIWNLIETHRTKEDQPVLDNNVSDKKAHAFEIDQQATLVMVDTIQCHLDELRPSLVKGWALDLVNPKSPLSLHVFVNNEKISIVECDLYRKDVEVAGYPSALVGFAFVLPRKFFNAQQHRLEFRTTTGAIICIDTPAGKLAHIDFCEKWKPAIRSQVDGMHEGVIKGWVLREEEHDHLWQGGCSLLVTCNGAHVANIKANRYRPDVAKSHAASAECGFEFSAPSAFRKAHPQAFRFIVVPYDVEVTGSPYVTSFVSDGNEAALRTFNDILDRMYVEMTQLRRQLKTMLPKRIHSLADYDTWARRYLHDLRNRVEIERQTLRREKSAETVDPLVSIICPTWRPVIADFRAAIESVIVQTWQKWELIIIDDGSQMPELTAQIETFINIDHRIRRIKLDTNCGISEATNVGLNAARGEWIGFFDHDDLLVPVAIEVMVNEARRSRAKLLYSDEDKIDHTGLLSEPSFKTDWNYRLLLGCNYICHFVMLDRQIQRRVGLLDASYNGAQDHDYLLRVTEMLKPDEIHHVAEVLYHWRKSATSTASATSAKEYAVTAGVNAVQGHLDRLGKMARVKNFNDTTWYKIEWSITAEPKVTIIIPFKDQIETTEHCVNCILANTAYRNFDIILVDNWSTSEESVSFVETVSQLDQVLVLRVEEEFNYSRLNNIAAHRSNASFFVLMNNDLFVTDKMWLRTLVNEALVDAQVGIVGGKFVYPNRTVQHAGVVLGVGGVACHVHTGIAENDPGYAARALFAQEMSAVTAACLLIRSDVYWEVGGLDEKHLAVAFNDVDLCIKTRLAGYKVIWTPDFLAEHHESLSRGSDEIRPEKEARFFHEMQTMIERYGELLKRDPFYSKHFTLDHRPFYDLTEV